MRNIKKEDNLSAQLDKLASLLIELGIKNKHTIIKSQIVKLLEISK